MTLVDGFTVGIPTQYAAAPPLPIQVNGEIESSLVDLSQVAQHVFGRLVQYATGAIPGEEALRHYHSDLWHDAEWLRNNLKGERMEFWFGFDSNGTHIGTDPVIIPFRKTFYRVTVEIRANRLGNDAYVLMARVQR